MKVDLELIRQSVHQASALVGHKDAGVSAAVSPEAGEQANGHEVLIIGDAAQIMRQEGQWSALVDSYGPSIALTPYQTAANLLSGRGKIVSAA
jgi:hypothetical protein